jgi:hypothetical protein
MNKNIKLAVAGAVLALSASANAGIIIPAGDWTVDIGGNVNSFVTSTKLSGNQRAGVNADGREDTPVNIQTGLLPSAFGIGAKTRQNDLDVGIQFSFFTGSNANGGDNLHVANAGVSNGGLGYSSLNIRQSYLTFGDKSWGSVLVGRNLGVYGSDAILSDMTLLGVGSGAGGSGSSTLGRIGSGYLYADWKAQVAYTTPNFSGFSAQVALTEATGSIDNSQLGYEGKVNYDFGNGDTTGKLWVSGRRLDIQTAATAFAPASQTGVPTVAGAGTLTDYTAEAFDIGGKVANGGAELVAYYYTGKNSDAGNGTAINTSTTATANFRTRDNHGGYIQGTYKLPGVGTKLGVSYGKSVVERNATAADVDAEREAWIIGAYHPLTKHVNIVAEFNSLDVTAHANTTGKAQTGSLGAILFF